MKSAQLAFLRAQSTAERWESSLERVNPLGLVPLGSAVTFSPDLKLKGTVHGKSQAMCVYMIIEVMAELKQPLGIQHFGH